MNSDFTFTPIGIVHSCFTEKFGIPRQPGLVPAARGSLEIFPPYDQDEAFRGMDRFSHVWVLFVFHDNISGGWRPTVRPPRLGGNQRMGVFATRSGFRPNPLGMSVVRQEGRRRTGGRFFLDVSGIDILDQTPVLDIKPYLPYTDRIADASGGFAAALPLPQLTVEFSDSVRPALSAAEDRYPGFSQLLRQVLAADPRPAYTTGQSGKTHHGLRLYDLNIRWVVEAQTATVLSIASGAIA
ncbi:tRNA (N6-threonylcarbamoyladenosine(37)-N6)-methyltransferase TrmO [Desulfosarcina sp. OttesenSCG-928-A07]|nr:tRNA (N6-threonylcarbamoyladenosine(37)-N6)-methyltransferase TrmO [Desulfosarcina sp. OttesenSCG-928-G17]MDL2330233.1 tRNA (N6-threonylcarbamoyladenosine(37)-N6)-methyltransferase TrmO [Desulfosarcina sp. OttesenSCG-928-A07]